MNLKNYVKKVLSDLNELDMVEGDVAFDTIVEPSPYIDNELNVVGYVNNTAMASSVKFIVVMGSKK